MNVAENYKLTPLAESLLEEYDSDKVRFYGSDVLNKLSDVSSIIANCILEFGDADIIEQLRNTIDSIDHLTNSKGKTFTRLFNPRRLQYKELLNMIGDLRLKMKLQQIKLLKILNIFEYSKNTIDRCLSALDSYISFGISKLENSINEVSLSVNPEDKRDFLNRLEKKVNELETAKIVANQTKTQIVLMSHNYEKLSDKIYNASSVTIPLWINQVSFMYNLELYNESNSSELKTEKTIQNNIRQLRGDIKNSILKIREKKTVLSSNINEDVIGPDSRLKQSLLELTELERKAENDITMLNEILAQPAHS